MKNKLSYKNFLKKNAYIKEKTKESSPSYPNRTWSFPNLNSWSERRFKETVLKNFKNKRFRSHHQLIFLDQDGADIFFFLRDEKGKTHHFVRIRDTSTSEYHLLRVPGRMRSCREAIAWTFGMSAEEYKLLKEA